MCVSTKDMAKARFNPNKRKYHKRMTTNGMDERRNGYAGCTHWLQRWIVIWKFTQNRTNKQNIKANHFLHPFAKRTELNGELYTTTLGRFINKHLTFLSNFYLIINNKVEYNKRSDIFVLFSTRNSKVMTKSTWLCGEKTVEKLVFFFGAKITECTRA